MTTTPDTTPTANVAAVTAPVIAGDDGRAAFAAIGIDPFTAADVYVIATTPGGSTIMRTIAADVYRWDGANDDVRRAVVDIDRAAADARTAVAAGHRIDPRTVTSAADRFADAVTARQSVADRMVGMCRIARDMIPAAPVGCVECATPTTADGVCPACDPGDVTP